MTFAANLAQSGSNNVTMRNRLINGAMVIDQRNAGASVTPADSAYTLDRWQSRLSQASKYSVQQSTTAPTGFKNSLLVTSLSSYTVGSSEFFQVRQIIEGLNTYDFSFGTASAQPVTLSFWVRSSLTGTFGGVLSNADGDRTYVFSYTVSSANTFEYKTITIPGDTTGTWLTTNGGGFVVAWSLGAGSSVSTTAGAWNASLFRGVTGGTSVVGTSGATFYITGVQLEKGTAASPFENRLYGTELALCYRYAINYTSATATGIYFRYVSGQCGSTSGFEGAFPLPVPMRTTPSLTTTATAANYGVFHAGVISPVSVLPSVGADGSNNQVVNFVAGTAAVLVAGRAATLLSNANNSSFLLLSAEL
jgi:hypothetical protein